MAAKLAGTWVNCWKLSGWRWSNDVGGKYVRLWISLRGERIAATADYSTSWAADEPDGRPLGAGVAKNLADAKACADARLRAYVERIEREARNV
jgi:hypothetical protein